MSLYNKLALFVGGTLFGSVGIKLLSSKDAKKAYVHATAAGLRMKDYVMETVTTVQENASDILASAKDLNEERAAKEAEEAAAAQLLRKSNRKEPLIRLFFYEGEATNEGNYFTRKQRAYPFSNRSEKNDFAGSRCAGKLVSKEIMDHTSNCP